jgi:hypothetical protein
MAIAMGYEDANDAGTVGWRSDPSAKSLRVQSQQFPTESQIFEDRALAGTASTDHPAEKMSERRDDSKKLTGTFRIQPPAKSFILQVYDVLARHTPCLGQTPRILTYM